MLDIFPKTDLGPAATELVKRGADAIGAVAGPALKPWRARAEVAGFRRPAKFREVPPIPWLKPWREAEPSLPQVLLETAAIA